MFHCDKCGICCRSLRRSPLYSGLDRGDGVCRYLDGELVQHLRHAPLALPRGRKL